MKHFGQESGGIVMKLIVALGVVTFLFFFYLVRHPMFRFIAESWIVEDPLNKADALIVLVTIISMRTAPHAPRSCSGKARLRSSSRVDGGCVRVPESRN